MTANMTASPIRRMSTSVGTAGGSLADESGPEESAALVEHALLDCRLSFIALHHLSSAVVQIPR
jgi:hypothetical protein